MTPPAPGTVRVFARVGIDGLRPGEWGDLPDRRHLADLVDMEFVTLTDYDGNGPPEDLPPPRCCL